MPALLPGQVKQLAYSVMNEKQIGEFEAKQEMNRSISAENLGRFRVNVFVQRAETGMVVRYIKNKIPPLAALGLLPVLEKLVLRKRGLVPVTGATGSGKSTTLASMINYRNENVTGHILTIEDPLEFLRAHERSVVDQREVGIDTQSYEEALKNALREAPDVIMIGEIRDRNTMKQAIAYAETGHFCLSTLHANNANQTDGAGHQLLPLRCPSPAADGPEPEPGRRDLAAPDPRPARKAGACGRGDAQFALHRGPDRQRRVLGHQGGHGPQHRDRHVHL